MASVDLPSQRTSFVQQVTDIAHHCMSHDEQDAPMIIIVEVAEQALGITPIGPLIERAARVYDTIHSLSPAAKLRAVVFSRAYRTNGQLPDMPLTKAADSLIVSSGSGQLRVRGANGVKLHDTTNADEPRGPYSFRGDAAAEKTIDRPARLTSRDVGKRHMPAIRVGDLNLVLVC